MAFGILNDKSSKHYLYKCLSTDTKPTTFEGKTIPGGSQCYETDTTTLYEFDGVAWVTADQYGTGNAGTRNLTTTLGEFSSTATGTAVTRESKDATFQATSDDTNHDGTSVISIQMSLDDVQYKEIGTLTLTGTDDTAIYPSSAPYKYTRAVCTTFESGGGGAAGTITVTMVEA